MTKEASGLKHFLLSKYIIILIYLSMASNKQVCESFIF